MRRSLGRVLAVWLISGPVLWSAVYRWNILASPETLQVGESGVVRYECVFDTSAADYTIDFKSQGNESYGAEVLTQSDRIVSGKRVQTFDILVTPKRTGTIEVELNALVRHTTFASIENATIGRDNVKKYDFNDEKVSLPTTVIRAQENSADLIGKITLEAKVDKKMVRAHEPVHLSVRVKGAGNLDRFVPYEINISGVKVFAEAPQKNFLPSREGFEGEIRQEFALVAEKGFTIPPLRLNVYDTLERKMKTFETAAVSVSIEDGYGASELLDSPDLGESKTWRRYAFYAVLVAAGALLGEVVRRLWKRLPRRRGRYFWEDAKNTKELAVWLSMRHKSEYEPIIRGLEEGSVGLSQAKKKLGTLTQEQEVK